MIRVYDEYSQATEIRQEPLKVSGTLMLEQVLTAREAMERLRSEFGMSITYTQVIRSIQTGKLSGKLVLGRWVVFSDGLKMFAEVYSPSHKFGNIRRKLSDSKETHVNT